MNQPEEVVESKRLVEPGIRPQRLSLVRPRLGGGDHDRGDWAEGFVGELARAQVRSADRARQQQVEHDEGERARIGGQLTQRVFAIGRIGDEIPMEREQLRQPQPHVVAILDEENNAAARSATQLGHGCVSGGYGPQSMMCASSSYLIIWTGFETRPGS